MHWKWSNFSQLISSKFNLGSILNHMPSSIEVHLDIDRPTG